MSEQTGLRYNRTARALHWAAAVLILANLASGFAKDALGGTWNVVPLHKSIGLTVLILGIVRLVWRLAHPAPPLPDTMPPWQLALAKAVHAVFYALIIVVPLTGWVMSSASKYPLSWFGLVTWPKFAVTRESAAYAIAHEGHELLGFGFAALVVVHVAAALYHHFVVRDHLLSRMA